jgi:hypothetical protein
MPNWNITGTVIKELLPVTTPTTLVIKKSNISKIKAEIDKYTDFLPGARASRLLRLRDQFKTFFIIKIDFNQVLLFALPALNASKMPALRLFPESFPSGTFQS